MSILAGNLRQRITINAKTITGRGDRGQPIYTWTAIASNVPAMVQGIPLFGGGKKIELAKQLVSQATHIITLRYNSLLTTDCQIVLSSGKVLNIGHLQNHDECGFRHVATCIEQETGI